MPRHPQTTEAIMLSASKYKVEKEWRVDFPTHWHAAYTRNILVMLRETFGWETKTRERGSPYTLLDALKAINKAQYRDWPELEQYNPALAKRIRHNGWVTRIKEALRTRVF